ncbi:O-antigen ligase family protein [Moheibacter sediminis]|uniref:O-antigen ligase n=1 Tax=Moheibacter sediminis TaxID=1434700 RepID=A0A1W1YC22_9FLAO|nr:O-antigen ligase family protein [Moheibacter sediminis]SMC33361.1 O-antigen ligase [Moheibacter sediminis]
MTFTQLKEPLFYISLAGVLITLVFPEHSINSKAIIFSVVCWLLYNPFSEKLRLIKKNIVPFLVISALFWISCLGMIYTENTNEGTKILTRNLPFLIFPLIFSSIKIDEKGIQFLLKYFSFSVILAAMFTLGKAFYLKLNNLGSYFHFLKLEELQDKHNTYFAMFCVFAITYFLFHLKKKTWCYLGCILFLLGYIYLLSVRISIVALVLIGVVYLISQRKTIPSRYFYFIFIGCAFIPVVFYFSPSFQEKFNPYTPQGEKISDVDSRKIHWQAALDHISRNNILLGQGTGDGHEGLFETYKKFGFYTGFAEKYNAHNQYIEIALYYGAIGLVILLTMLVYALKINLLQKDYFAVAIVVVFAVFMVTESILQRHDGIVLCAFFISLFSMKKISENA